MKYFNHQHLCDFKIDERSQHLHEMLVRYYDLTPDCVDNKTASKHWREFREKARDYGFSSSEINNAKHLALQESESKQVSRECDNA